MSALTASAAAAGGRAAPLRHWLGRHPFSSGLALLYLLIALVFGRMAGPDTVLRRWLWVTLDAKHPFGHWWAPVTGMIFAGDLPELVVAVTGSLVLLGTAEHLMGWRRTAFAFVITALAGTLAGAGLILFGEFGQVPWARSIVRIATVDPQSGIFGAVAAASAFAGVLWRRRIRLLTVLVAVVFVLYSGQPADVYRLAATAAGLWLGVLIRKTPRRATWGRSSQHETRTLLAAVTALSAFGPAIAIFSRTRVGPLGPIGTLLAVPSLPSRAVLHEHCSALPFPATCLSQGMLERIANPGEILVSIAPLIVLLMAAWGLLHGRAFAVWLGVGIQCTLGTLAAVFFTIIPARVAGPLVGGDYHDVQFQLDAVLSVAFPFAVAIALILGHRNFPVRSSAKSAVGYLVTLGCALAGLGALYLCVLIPIHAQLRGAQASAGRYGVAALARFVPVAFLDHGAIIQPVSLIERVIAHTIGPAFWTVVVLGALRPLFGTTAHTVRGGARRARALVEARGATLSFMTTWPGNEYWFSPDGNAAVAYRLIGRVAITTGGPVGHVGDLRTLIGQFARYCDDNGWIPIFYSVEADLAPAFRALGWHTRTVAEEAVLNPLTMEMTGRKWQKVRSSVNKARREGLTPLWCTWSELSLPLSQQLSALSEEWVAGKELPEMGFTLGGLAEARDPAVRLMIAVDASGQVQAFTSWLPVYRDKRIVGYTNDIMRRRLGGTHGAMDFTIASVVERLREDGIGLLSLSAAPLARSEPSGADGLDRLLERLSERLEPAYGFRSLLNFKRKFQPELTPLLIAYPDAAALPVIGLALIRAYLPTLSLRNAIGMVRELARSGESAPETTAGPPMSLPADREPA